jgi:hypothetical protein
MGFRNTFANAVLATLILGLAAPVPAGINLQVAKRLLGDPGDPSDDIVVPAPLRWSEESMPIQFYVFNPGGSVGSTADDSWILPGFFNNRGVSDLHVINSLNRSMERWNDVPYSNMEFNASILQSYQAFVFDPINLPYGPEDMRIDGYNLITFQDPVLSPGVGIASITTITYFNRDWDPSEGPFLPGSTLSTFTEIVDEGVATVIGVRVPGSDIYDPDFTFLLQNRSYKAGEIFDADTSLAPMPGISGIDDPAGAFGGWYIFPDDKDQLVNYDPPLTEETVLGLPDLEGVFMRSFGQMAGLGPSFLFNSVMSPYIIYQTTLLNDISGQEFLADPYVRRELTLDDEITMAAQYPSEEYGFSAGVFGDVINGALVWDGSATPSEEFTVPGIPNQLVFIGKPRNDDRIDLDTLTSQFSPGYSLSEGFGELNAGNIQLIAHTFTGRNIPLFHGVNSGFDPIITPNGQWEIRGLEPGCNYYLFLAPPATMARDYSVTVSEGDQGGGGEGGGQPGGTDVTFDTLIYPWDEVSQAYEARYLSTSVDEYETEFFGGVVDTSFRPGSGNGPDGDTDALSVRSKYVRVGVTGQGVDFNNDGEIGPNEIGISGDYFVQINQGPLFIASARTVFKLQELNSVGAITETFYIANDGFGFGAFPGQLLISDETVDVIDGLFTLTKSSGQIIGSIRMRWEVVQFPSVSGPNARGVKVSWIFENSSPNDYIVTLAHFQDVVSQFTGDNLLLSNPDIYVNGNPTPQFSTLFAGGGVPDRLTWFNNPARKDYRFSVLANTTESGLTPPAAAMTANRFVLFPEGAEGFFNMPPGHPLAFNQDVPDPPPVSTGILLRWAPQTVAAGGSTSISTGVTYEIDPVIPGSVALLNLQESGLRAISPSERYGDFRQRGTPLCITGNLGPLHFVTNRATTDDIPIYQDSDRDGDGVVDFLDNCPFTPNEDQLDSNGNGVGDVCEGDVDGDGIPDFLDNCANTPNPEQTDIDLDGIGDVCDTDIDGDGVPNDLDNCPLVMNPDQADSNNNGIGDACEGDFDGDGVADEEDNCPSIFNPSQSDLDGNGIGDSCDPDIDGDGVANEADNCPFVFNPGQEDSDDSGIGDACENIGFLLTDVSPFATSVLQAQTPDTNLSALGVAVGDINGDGYNDILLAINATTDQSTGGRANRVWLNDGKSNPGKFRDVTFGINGQPQFPSDPSNDDRYPISQDSTSFILLFDFDNDGDLDAYEANQFTFDRLLMNVDVDDPAVNPAPDGDSFGDGFFIDVSGLALPRLLELPRTGRVRAADVNADGALDLIIAHLDFGFDIELTESSDEYQKDFDPPEGEEDGPGDLQGFIGGPLRYSERILINRRNDLIVEDGIGGFMPIPYGVPDPFLYLLDSDPDRYIEIFPPLAPLINPDGVETTWFRDETLGKDQIFNGVVGYVFPGGIVDPTQIVPEEMRDRLPPLMMDLLPAPQSGSDVDVDWSITSEVAVGRFLDFSPGPDIYVGNAINSGIESRSGSSIDGYNPVLSNLDLDGDWVPDGYFFNVNFGTDFIYGPVVTVVIDPDNEITEEVPTIMWPFLIGIPEVSDADSPPKSDSSTGEDDDWPLLRYFTTGVASADIFNRGFADLLDASTSDGIQLSTTYNVLGAGDHLPGMGIRRSLDQGFAPTFHGFSSGFALMQPWASRRVGIEYEVEPFGTIQSSLDYPIYAGAFLPTFTYTRQTPSHWAVEFSEGDSLFEDGAYVTRLRSIQTADFRRSGLKDVVTVGDAPRSLINVASTIGGLIDLWINMDASGFFQESWRNVSQAAIRPNDDNSRIAGTHLMPFDADGDGDFDLFVTLQAGIQRLFINSLFESKPSLTNLSDRPIFMDNTRELIDDGHGIGVEDFFLGPAPYNSFVAGVDSADVDRNGLIDLAIFCGAYLTSEGDRSQIFLNRGKPEVPGSAVYVPANTAYPGGRRVLHGFPYGLEPDLAKASSGKFVDINNDGSWDLIVGHYGEANRLYLNRNANAPDLFSFIPENPILDRTLLTEMGFDPATFYSTNNPRELIDPRDDTFPPEVKAAEGLGSGVFEDQSSFVVFDIDSNPIATRLPFVGDGDDPRSFTNEIAIGDINNDGFTDVLYVNGFAGAGAPNVLLMNRTAGDPGNSSYYTERYFEDVSHLLGPEASGLIGDSAHAVFFDVNNDGWLDLVVANRRIEGGAPPGVDEKMWLLLNQGGFGGTPGQFVLDPSFPSLTIYATKIGVADFSRRGDIAEDMNGDGIVTDVEIQKFEALVRAIDPARFDGDPNTTPQFEIREIDPVFDGGFRQPVVDTLLTGDPMNPKRVTRRPQRYLDIDGDGNFRQILDMVVTTAGPASAIGRTVYLANDGNGFFTPIESPFPDDAIVAERYYDISIGDVDGDGLLDFTVAFANALGSDRFPSARLYHNRSTPGTPVFARLGESEIPHPNSTDFGPNYDGQGELVGRYPGTDGNARGIELLDADGDGDLDLFVGELGRLGTDLRSYAGLNAFYENRLDGRGFSAPRTELFHREGVDSVPGETPVVPTLSLVAVSPSQAYRGEWREIRLYGSAFKPGAVVTFGQGVSVIGSPVVLNPGTIDVRVFVEAGTSLGGRTVRVYNPDGGVAESTPGQFIVLDAPVPEIPEVTDWIFLN